MSSQTWRGKRERELMEANLGKNDDFDTLWKSTQVKVETIPSNHYDDLQKQLMALAKASNLLGPKGESGELGEAPFNFVKIIQGPKEIFEVDLNKALNSGWEIPQGEGMKIFNQTYTILLRRKEEGKKHVKKFI